MSYFKLLVYLSLAFLVVRLTGDGYLVLPEVHSAPLLGAAFVLLFAGFLFEPLPWQRMLADSNMRVSYRICLISSGLPVFGKYIPGKLWAIVGRAWYVAEASGKPEGQVALVAVNAQVIALWTGLLVGAGTLVYDKTWQSWGLTALALWLMLSGLLVADGPRRVVTGVLRLMGGDKRPLPKLRLKQLVRRLPWYATQWVLWCLGFLLLADALSDRALPIHLAWSFALAATAGMLALVIPGGLGVREGLLAASMVSAGLTTSEAATTAAAARLWFAVGELFAFSIASLAARHGSLKVVDGSPPPS